MSSIGSVSSAPKPHPVAPVARRPVDADGDHDGTRAAAAVAKAPLPLATSGSLGRNVNVKA
jgi:hypothetical protein